MQSPQLPAVRISQPHTRTSASLVVLLAGVLGCGLSGLAAATSVRAAPPAPASSGTFLAACNSPDFQTVLHAMAQATPAVTLAASPAAAPSNNANQAVWLNRKLLQWPGAPLEGSVRLYHSTTGQISAVVGGAVSGADGSVRLVPYQGEVPTAVAVRFKYVKPGPVLSLPAIGESELRALHQKQLVLVQQDDSGRVVQATTLQVAGALDDLFADAVRINDLGASVGRRHTQFTLWAPTAQAVTVCQYPTSTGAAKAAVTLKRNSATGSWTYRHAASLSGQYYSYLVDGFVPGVGVVRNRVTDPYSVSLNTNSLRTYIADLNAAHLKPKGWDRQATPKRVQAATDLTVYELHVRDFSLGDLTVPEAQRGKYLAFTAAQSNGMRHLQALAKAGMTDVHLLPIFDLATIPEAGCVSPKIDTPASGDSEVPQAQMLAVAAQDCYNWGYDPYHFNAPEGSFATDASDGAKRIIELRQMVMALHATNLRVGMDVVYNHTSHAGQHPQSVLDRIVPGYYQRLNAEGVIERSTCCDNTATENMMMGKLMLDSVELWAKQYKMDSFRFDLMGHQPRAAMEALQTRVNKAVGRPIQLIGEGWNFGEVANGARFVQASQLSLNGTGIGTFSDRGRDAVRGGSAGDSGEAQISNQGYINGMVYDRNALSKATPTDLLRTADMVRVGLAGSIREFEMTTHTGQRKKLSDIDYGGQPAGYASEPSEVVNYVENHDNQTLYDINMFRLPVGTSTQDRVRVQMLGAAINAFSQGVAYFHAGMEVLRSKSMDRNSYDSGDWFNRLDWTYQDNYFGTGLPPKTDNLASWPLMRPYLADARNRPTPANIALTRDMFNDLLAIRASSTLFRLRTAADIKARLSFPNSGPTQNPVVLVGHLNGEGYAGAAFKHVIYFVNVDKTEQTLTLPEAAGKPFALHPVHMRANAADKRVRDSAQFDGRAGRFVIPARTALVYVAP